MRADEDLDLVAMATVADLVPLRGENRRLVTEGLRVLSRTEKPGLRALMKIASVEPRSVDAGAIGYRLAPRINAAGRLQRADAALELVLTDDDARRRGGRRARPAEPRAPGHRDAAAVRGRGGARRVAATTLPPTCWPARGGTRRDRDRGLAAGRALQPAVVLIALDGESGKGSGRSISAFDLHGGLAAASEHLVRFGGHRAAPAWTSLRRGRRIPPGVRRARGVGADARGPHARGARGRDRPRRLAEPAAVRGARAAGAVRLRQPDADAAGAGGADRDVRSMGQEAAHASFNVVSGGSRARAVAFRTNAKALMSRVDSRTTSRCAWS